MKVHSPSKAGVYKVPSTVAPVPKKGNNSGPGKSQSTVDNATEVEKTSSLAATTVVAGEKNVNPSSFTKPSKPLSIEQKASPPSTLATVGVKDANPILDMIVLLKDNKSMPINVTNLPPSFSSIKSNEQSNVVAKQTPTYVTAQETQQQSKPVSTNQNSKLDCDDKERRHATPSASGSSFEGQDDRKKSKKW